MCVYHNCVPTCLCVYVYMLSVVCYYPHKTEVSRGQKTT